MNRPFLFSVLLALGISSPLFGGDAPGKQTKKIDFARDIRPILANHCWSCHGPDEATRESGLRLDVREAALMKLKSGRSAIVPNDTKASTLLTRIDAKKESQRMPPPESKKPLSDVQKRLLKRWIEEGAEYTEHWAFIAPKRPALPTVKDKSWVRNPIDAFVLARLEAEGLKPSPEAEPYTLIRRMTLDVTGLPPTVEEVDEFVAAWNAPGAKRQAVVEKLADRLLASPRHAERMAMPWLDAARYADTNGYNNDEERFMWPWRDWVINAFRVNMPYDQFIVEQVAGDLLPNATVQQRIATGFNRNHVLTTEGGIFEEEYRVEYVADRVHTTATAFLGLSMQCARCHDHKYDPITQKEYYQFFAFFNNVNEKVVNYNKGGTAEPFILVAAPENQTKLAQIEKRRGELDRALKYPNLAVAVVLTREAATLDKQKAEISVPVMVMAEMSPPRQAYLLKRGQYDQLGDKLEPGVPAMLPRMPKYAPKNRLGLARWLVEPANPLTARVAVNRWWGMYFSAGLVETAEDFGLQGELPSHPELLDWLATEFIRTGWDVKAMQKLIVTSASYRQSSRVTKDFLDRDPKNHLLSRAPRQRLPAETIRDNALAVSGLLKDKIGGPSVKPYQPAGLWEDVSVERRYKYVADKGEGLYRRSMYTFWRRTCPPPSMMLFDAPDRETCFIRRARTNTPLHALVLMNDPTYLEAARKLAERIMAKESEPGPRLALALRTVLSRAPTEKEAAILLGMHAESLAKFKANPAAAKKLLSVGDSPSDAKLNEAELAAWTTVMNLVLNLDEAITKQ